MRFGPRDIVGDVTNSMTLALDGDDTLWHNETIFRDTQDWYRELLVASGVGPDRIHDSLIATERRNLGDFGYGIKGFMLSLIQTGIDLTNGTLPNSAIVDIIERGRNMINHPTALIDGVSETLEILRGRVRCLLLITKGDLLDQEAKVARSGIADHFDDVHIVTEKDSATYQRILDRHEIRPGQFVMVGNSLPSDVLPAIELGGHGIHIPYRITWEIETVAVTDRTPNHLTLDSIAELPEALASLATQHPQLRTSRTGNDGPGSVGARGHLE